MNYINFSPLNIQINSKIDQIQNIKTELTDNISEAFEIGNLKYNSEFSIPLLLPFPKEKAYAFYYDDPSLLFESFAFDILNNFPAIFCKFHFIDFESNTKYSQFKTLKTQGLEYILNDFLETKKLLASLRKDVMQDCLNAENSTLFEYIEKTNSCQYRLQFVFISNFSFHENENRLEEQIAELNNLIKEASIFGIYLFFGFSNYSNLPLNFSRNLIEIKVSSGLEIQGIEKIIPNISNLKPQISNLNQNISEKFTKISSKVPPSKNLEELFKIRLGVNAQNSREIIHFEFFNKHENYFLISGIAGVGKTNLYDVLIYNSIKATDSNIDIYIFDFKDLDDDEKISDFEVYSGVEKVKVISSSPIVASKILANIKSDITKKIKNGQELPTTLIFIDEVVRLLKVPNMKILLENLVELGRSANIKLFISIVKTKDVSIPDTEALNTSFAFHTATYNFNFIPWLNESPEIINNFKTHQKTVGIKGNCLFSSFSDTKILKIDFLDNKKALIGEYVLEHLIDRKQYFPERKLNIIKYNDLLHANLMAKKGGNHPTYIGSGIKSFNDHLGFKLEKGVSQNLLLIGPHFTEETGLNLINGIFLQERLNNPNTEIIFVKNQYSESQLHFLTDSTHEIQELINNFVDFVPENKTIIYIENMHTQIMANEFGSISMNFNKLINSASLKSIHLIFSFPNVTNFEQINSNRLEIGSKLKYGINSSDEGFWQFISNRFERGKETQRPVAEDFVPYDFNPYLDEL